MEMPIDAAIRQWQSYLTNISSNLMELSDKTEYQLIKAKAADKTNGYTGVTRTKAENCIKSVAELWQHFALLSEVVEKAVELNNKRSLLYNSADEIWELLEKTLIVIDKEHVDINDRSLIANRTNEKKATPKELLKSMQESFQALLKDIAEISSAQETLQSRISNIKSDISKLNSTALHLGITNVPVFDTDRVTQIEKDPLQGTLELDKLVYSIEKYRASIRTIEEDYNEIVLMLDRVKGMMSELKDLAAKSKAVIMESREVFGEVNETRPVISEEIINSLEDWIVVLENKLFLGAIKAVKVGTSKLEKECFTKLELEKESYDVNSRAVNEWLDLKGQFKALLAKAEVLESKGLLSDASLNELIRMTNAALHARPVKLEDCREFVKKFRLSL